MTFRQHTMRRLLPALVVATLALVACDAKPSDSPLPSAAVETIAVDDAIAAVEAIDDFTCGDAIPRADDYMWLCEGSRERVAATIHLFAVQVDAPVFGATLYTSAPGGEDADGAATATASLALELADATVPQPWREATRTWLSEHMPDGGRTLNVPDAGITASVQPLANLQWYVELYELDGLEPSSPSAS
jgi:hypothetical protein